MKQIKKRTQLLTLGLTILLSSCAIVKFYGDDKLKNETGIEFFSAKPYLLLERNPTKDVVSKVTIIYLPDRKNPHYAKIRPGLGSSDLKLVLENGFITSYGIANDSKVPETITAITGALTGTASAYTSIREAITGSKDKKEDKAVDLTDNIDNMKYAEKLIINIISDLNNSSADSLLSSNQKALRSSIIKKLQDENAKINNHNLSDAPEIVMQLKNAAKGFQELIVSPEMSNFANAYNGRMRILKSELTKAIEKLTPPTEEESPFELYEIIFSGDKTELKRVNF